ncbi:MAG: glycoside hydrolase family 43 protein [Chthoniobacteraceae bacterium]|nr:glycoside hydrolase family 43 protein [Chthoniobacteraceae bacterium]
MDLPAPGGDAAAFSNPILPAPAADPWVIQHGGVWFALLASERTLYLRAASNLAELSTATPVTIWRAPHTGPCSRNLWAPEMHRLDGRWFIYFAADDGKNKNHRMWVLEAGGANPFGEWGLRGMLDTGGWAIDGTVLEEGGKRFFVWSGWPGRKNEQQNLYISEMRTPWKLAGPRVPLAEPTEPWERVALPLCEGPQILRRGKRTFVIYSASGSWTPDYCLGMLINEDGNFLNPASWTKKGPVFQKTEHVWGVGHCCFAQHPDAGDLIFYHAKTDRSPGWDDRNVRVQPFGWTSEGLPDFGRPIPV